MTIEELKIELKKIPYESGIVSFNEKERLCGFNIIQDTRGRWLYYLVDDRYMIEDFYCFYTENEVCSFAFGKAYNDYYNNKYYREYGNMYLSIKNITLEIYTFTGHKFEINNFNDNNIRKPGYNVEKYNNKWFFYVLNSDLEILFDSKCFENEIDLSAFVFGYIYSEYIKST